MFGRHKQEPEIDTVSFETAIQHFDERWAASKLTRPSHFGDGRPFEPDPLVAELRDVYWRSIHLPDAQAAAQEGVFALLMVTLQDLKNPEPPPILRWVAFIHALRSGMDARGATEDGQTVSRFALYLLEYWESTGALDVSVDQLLQLL